MHPRTVRGQACRQAGGDEGTDTMQQDPPVFQPYQQPPVTEERPDIIAFLNQRRRRKNLFQIIMRLFDAAFSPYAAHDVAKEATVVFCLTTSLLVFLLLAAYKGLNAYTGHTVSTEFISPLITGAAWGTLLFPCLAILLALPTYLFGARGSFDRYMQCAYVSLAGLLLPVSIGLAAIPLRLQTSPEGILTIGICWSAMIFTIAVRQSMQTFSFGLLLTGIIYFIGLTMGWEMSRFWVEKAILPLFVR